MQNKINGDWVKEYSKIYPRKQLTIEHNKTFNTTITYDTLVSYCKRHKIPALKMRYYNKIQEEWLKNNITTMPLDELTIAFNKQFGTNKTKAALKTYCKNRNWYANKYTEEQTIWLKNNANNYTKNDLTKQFNKQFNTNKTKNAIISYCSKFKFTNKRVYFSKEDMLRKKQWIQKYSGTVNAVELTALFNKEFNTNYKSLKDFIYDHGIKHNKYIYNLLTKEQKEWIKNNFNTKYNWKQFTNKFNQYFNTNYTKDQIAIYTRNHLNLHTTTTERMKNYREGYPIGFILKAANGITYIKIKNGGKINGGIRRPNWVPYKEYLYTQKYGPISKDELVISLDGSFDIDKLVAIDKATYTILQTRGYSNQGLLTEAMLEILKTKKLIKEMEGE